LIGVIKMIFDNNYKTSENEFLQAFHKGKEHFDNNRLEDAKVFLEKAYKIKLNDEKVLNLLGMVYFKLNNLNEAETIYSKLIETNPSIYVLHSNLGLIRLKLGKLEEAKYNLTKALELQPNNPKAQVYLGLLYEKLGNYEVALSYFEKGGATKLIEQLKEKMALEKKKEEEIEEADIIEVIDKKTIAEKEKVLFEEPKPLQKEEIQTPLITEEQLPKTTKIITEEQYPAEHLFPQKEQLDEEYRKKIRTMAQELGVDMRPSHYIEESEQEEEEITPQTIQEQKEIPIETKKEEPSIFAEEESKKEFLPEAKEEVIIEEEKFEEQKEQEIQVETPHENVEISVEQPKEEEIFIKPKAEKKVIEEKIEEKIEIFESRIQEEIIAPHRESETSEITTSKEIGTEFIKEETPAEPEKEKIISVEEVPKEIPIIAPEAQPSIYKPLSLDYFSKDRFYIQPLTGADRFLLVDSHLLEVVLSHEIIIKKGTISSFSGEMKFEPTPFNFKDIPFIKCTGTGIIFLSHERKEILLFSLNNEEVNIEANHFLVAQSTLSIDAKYLIDQNQIPYLNIKGTGTLGISLRSQPLTLNVLSSMPVNIYSDALIAWSGNLSINIIQEEELKNIMVSYEENAIPLEFRGIGDVVVEQGSLWGNRRTKF